MVDFTKDLNVVSTFNNGLLIKIDRSSTFINTIDPIITKNCNLLCPHCWGCNNENTNMDYLVYCKMLKLAKFLKIQKVQFTGGEPTLNQDFLNFARISKSNNLENKLRTNFAVKILDDYTIINILENFTSIYISLDGDYKLNFSLRPSKEYIAIKNNQQNFDKLAKLNFKTIKTNFEKLLNFREKLNTKNYIIIASVIQKKNIDHIDKILNFINKYYNIRWDITQVILKENDQNYINSTDFLEQTIKISKKFQKHC